MQVEFVAGFSPIVADVASARRLYADGLGLRFEGGTDVYPYTETLAGVRHLGLWPLHEAARACFGTDAWPGDVPVPQATLEFEVLDVEAAADELVLDGHRLLHGAKREPWGQTIARLLTADGLLIAVCFTPEFHPTGEDHR